MQGGRQAGAGHPPVGMPQRQTSGANPSARPARVVLQQAAKPLRATDVFQRDMLDGFGRG
jgi:hypothetical protein